LKDKDLDSKRYEEFYRPLMTFTKVIYSTDEERGTMHKSQISLNRENLMKNSEEGCKIQSTRCLSFKKTDVNAEKGRQIDSLNHSAEEHRGKNPKKCKF
jgi:hypothetical protein